jgi:hypothetical protein
MEIGGGGRFDKLQGEVAAGYMEKGMSAARAKQIGAAVAAKQGRKKYGKKKFQTMAAAGRRRAA